MFQLKTYTIPKLNSNFDLLQDGNNELQTTISICIMIPKDKENKENVIEIEAVYKNSNNEELLDSLIRGTFVWTGNIEVEKDQIKSVLKDEAVPVLYSKLRNFLQEYFNMIHIDFVNIKPFSPQMLK